MKLQLVNCFHPRRDSAASAAATRWEGGNKKYIDAKENVRQTQQVNSDKSLGDRIYIYFVFGFCLKRGMIEIGNNVMRRMELAVVHFYKGAKWHLCITLPVHPLAVRIRLVAIKNKKYLIFVYIAILTMIIWLAKFTVPSVTLRSIRRIFAIRIT